MPGDIAVRLATAAGRSRVVLPATATFGDFQEEVKKRTGVEALAQKFAFDPKGQKTVGGALGTPLSQLGIVNGAQLHLVNQDAEIAAQILTKQPVPVEPEQQISKSGDTTAAQSSAASSTAASSSSGGGPPKTTQATTGDGKKADPKFETFDSFLRNRRYDIASLPGSQKYVSSRLTDKGMIKIPPSVSIKQQPYRHVDTLSVINVPEMEHFIGYWQNELLENAMQRVGWMYGYYLEDNNYDEGCRAVLEGIYEPPQEVAGEMAVPKDDPNRVRVDKIAEALGLECIGWIFTTLPLEDGLFLSPTEVLRIARLQNEYSTDIHFTRYSLSKFVSCAVRPDASMNGLPSLFPYMVSEQVCAMVRDGILSESGDRTHCVVRDGEKGELISDFIVEGKANKRIATDFFIVRVNDTAPKKHQRMFTHAEFPRENRHTHPQRRADLKKYFRNISNSEPSWSRFADFHLLLYIAQEIDLDSALTICECIRDRKEVPEGILMIINQLVQ